MALLSLPHFLKKCNHRPSSSRFFSHLLAERRIIHCSFIPFSFTTHSLGTKNRTDTSFYDPIAGCFAELFRTAPLFASFTSSSLMSGCGPLSHFTIIKISHPNQSKKHEKKIAEKNLTKLARAYFKACRSKIIYLPLKYLNF